jgi:transposase
VGYNFVPCDRNQDYAMPPSIKDWLPEDHPVWFMIETIEAMRPKLQAFYGRYRSDGWGRAAYEPMMMLTLLCYAYRGGLRRSRDIERHCREDVAFRVITANRVPDHATIARFRQANEAAIEDLFAGVLALCREAGLVEGGLIAIDGTKIAADASSKRNRTAEAIDKEVDAIRAREILHEAEAADKADDEQLGLDVIGHEVPEALRTRKGRAEWLEARKQKLLDDEAARKADHEQRLREHEEAKARGSDEAPPRAPHPPRGGQPKVNLTDPDSKTMKTVGGYLQGYNAQAAVNENQVIVAAKVTNAAADVHELKPMIEAAKANLAEAGAAGITTVVADAGYYSDHNAGLSLGPDLLICPTARNEEDLEQARVAEAARAVAEAAYRAALGAAEALADRRQEVFDLVGRKQIDMAAAAAELGISSCYAYALYRRYRTLGRDGLMPKKLPPKPRGGAKGRMLEKFATEEGKATYALRAQTAEPVFGQIKEARGVRRFMRRGLQACNSEWMLIAAVHNLGKLRPAKAKKATCPSPGGPLNTSPSTGTGLTSRLLVALRFPAPWRHFVAA